MLALCLAAGVRIVGAGQPLRTVLVLMRMLEVLLGHRLVFPAGFRSAVPACTIQNMRALGQRTTRDRISSVPATIPPCQHMYHLDSSCCASTSFQPPFRRYSVFQAQSTSCNPAPRLVRVQTFKFQTSNVVSDNLKSFGKLLGMP